jgi:hypothetical protein
VSSYNILCKRIIELDRGIRFVGVADHIGKLIAYEYRKGHQPLLSKEETERSITQSAIRMGTRKTLEHKLGKIVYAFAMYEQVKRATIPIDGEEKDKILMISFDIGVEHEPIILKKIIPLIEESHR